MASLSWQPRVHAYLDKFCGGKGGKPGPCKSGRKNRGNAGDATRAKWKSAARRALIKRRENAVGKAGGAPPFGWANPTPGGLSQGTGVQQGQPIQPPQVPAKNDLQMPAGAQAPPSSPPDPGSGGFFNKHPEQAATPKPATTPAAAPPPPPPGRQVKNRLNAGQTTRFRWKAAAAKAAAKRRENAAARKAALGNAPAAPATPIGTKAETGTRRALKTLEVVDQQNLGGGINGTYKVKLKDGSYAIWKPQAGEYKGQPRDNIPKGEQYMREAMTYDMAEIVGTADLVPACVLRTIDGKVGSIAKWQEGADVARRVDKDKRFDGAKDLARSAAFDILVGNEDRHSGNWMVKSDGKLALIDNGLSFPEDDKVTGNTAIISRAANKGLAMPKEVKQWASKWPQIEAKLRSNGFNDSVINSAKKRLDVLSSESTINDAAKKLGIYTGDDW